MTEPTPNTDSSAYNIDSDDDADETEAANLVADDESKSKTEAILSSYLEYISEIQEELPPDSAASAAAAEFAARGRDAPLEPDEETPIDASMDPPEESVDFIPKSRFDRAKGRIAKHMPRGRRKRENQVYDNAEDELDEMYNELGVVRPSRKYRYTHPTLHSRKCLVCTALTVAVVIIVGAVIGSKKKEEEWLIKEEDKLHSMLHPDDTPTEGGSEEVVSEAQRESEAFEKVVKMYKPLWFDRGDGWEGQSYDEGILFCASNSRILCPYEAYCPLGAGTAPLGGGQKVPQSWAPLIDNENGWVQIGQTGQCKQWKEIYTDVPSWGETGAGSEIITEHIMCCQPHSIDGQQRPGAQQGSFSSGATDMDKPVAEPEAEEPAVDLSDTNWEQTMFEGVNNAEYEPTWYSRSTGWDGTTFAEALQFCGSKESIICPFEAVCPNGPDHAPEGGEKLAPEGGVAWTPIVMEDQTNEWVGVSHSMQCIKYTNVHKTPPSWGIGGDNEAETRYVACCKTSHAAVSDSDSGGDSNALSDVTIGIPATPNPTNPPTPEPSYITTTAEATVAEQAEAASLYASSINLELVMQSVAEQHEPVWFDRSGGWSGQSWPEASSFCLSQVDYSGKGMQLCPLGVICPIPNASPMLGAREAPTDDAEGRGAWAPFGNMEDGWIKVDQIQPCVVYNTIYGDKPEWGMTGDGAEAITRNVLCCKSTSQATTPPPTVSPITAEVASVATLPPTSQPTEKPTNDKLVADTFEKLEEKFDPLWHDRQVWKGSSYIDAIEFCAKMGGVICPYEAYCPLGPGPHLYEGARAAATVWAPLIDVPNGWVQVGSQDTCEVYNALHPHPPLWGLNGQGDEDITQHIMCCDDGFTTIAEQAALASRPPIYSTPTALEQKALDSYHPIWFQRKHGYDGTTHAESMDFCEHIGDMELCPLSVYCPNGESGSLFYGRDAFSGEQWAPIATSSDSQPDWVQIGTMDGASTCTTYSSTYGTEAPWDSNGESEHKKQHILCCQRKNVVTDEFGNESTMQEVMANSLQPVWYSESHGWNGGTHNDAVLFCSASGNRELCPSIAICPNGKGQAPMGGHNVDFVAEGEQWAPVGGMDNHWIQIGQKYENLATTCMDYRELNGVDTPDWGTTNDNADKKKYIMCCKKLDS